MNIWAGVCVGKVTLAVRRWRSRLSADWTKLEQIWKRLTCRETLQIWSYRRVLPSRECVERVWVWVETVCAQNQTEGLSRTALGCCGWLPGLCSGVFTVRCSSKVRALLSSGGLVTQAVGTQTRVNCFQWICHSSSVIWRRYGTFRTNSKLIPVNHSSFSNLKHLEFCRKHKITVLRSGVNSQHAPPKASNAFGIHVFDYERDWPLHEISRICCKTV